MDARRIAVLRWGTGILRGMPHREVIAARKSQKLSFSRTAIVLTVKMLVSAFFSSPTNKGAREENMDRRAFLATSAAGAMLATVKGAMAETERPVGETGVPLHGSSEARLPLGVLPNTRYPDTHIELIDKRFKVLDVTTTVDAGQPQLLIHVDYMIRSYNTRRIPAVAPQM